MLSSSMGCLYDKKGDKVMPCCLAAASYSKPSLIIFIHINCMGLVLISVAFLSTFLFF